jgi:predicted transglutaminase-like cysteine proteinase
MDEIRDNFAGISWWRGLLLLAAMLGLTACAATGASTGAGVAATKAAPTGAFMTLGAATAAPDGYVDLCARSPVDCTASARPAELARTALKARALIRERWGRLLAEKQAALATASVAEGTGRPSPTIAPAATVAEGDGFAGPVVAHDAEAVAAAATGLAAHDAVAQGEGIGSPAPEAATTTTDSGARDGAPVPAAAAAYARLPVTRALWRTLGRVNERVNGRIRKASDQDAWGVADYWTAPLADGGQAKGDCEDYALEKRRELIAEGVPGAALSIAAATTPWGEAHAVLVVDTEAGEYVLDNLDPRVRPWGEAGYAWIARQSPTDPLTWVALGAAAQAKPQTVAALGPGAGGS